MYRSPPTPSDTPIGGDPGSDNERTVPAAPQDRAYVAAARLRVQLLWFQRRMEEIAARHALTPERYLLLLLVRSDALLGTQSSVSSLCGPLQMTQSSVSRLVAGAVRAGLLDREPNPLDHRGAFLCLTESGRKRLDGAFDELGPERDRLAEALRRNVEEAWPAIAKPRASSRASTAGYRGARRARGSR